MTPPLSVTIMPFGTASRTRRNCSSLNIAAFPGAGRIPTLCRANQDFVIAMCLPTPAQKTPRDVAQSRRHFGRAQKQLGDPAEHAKSQLLSMNHPPSKLAKPIGRTQTTIDKKNPAGRFAALTVRAARTRRGAAPGRMSRCPSKGMWSDQRVSVQAREAEKVPIPLLGHPDACRTWLSHDRRARRFAVRVDMGG